MLVRRSLRVDVPARMEIELTMKRVAEAQKIHGSKDAETDVDEGFSHLAL